MSSSGSRRNRFFTILVVPEKTSQVRRFVLPSWVVRASFVALFFAVMIATIMVLDYWFVMNQIAENKELKIENRRLQQQVQIFKNKMATLESTMDRVRTFATRLKVITNIEDRGSLIQSLNQKLPESASNIGMDTPKRSSSSALAALADLLPTEDPEVAQLKREYDEMDSRFSDINYKSLVLEQTLQDQYELLADQKSFLSALPTRKPVVGYFTSGFGIRSAPIGGRIKMHEGLDIANRPGTSIKAPADGTVTFSGIKPGYGQTVIIDHGYGLETWYGHARKLLVKSGQRIRRGEIVAQLGTSGRSTGPHLHYEVRVHGTPVDPLSYILEN